MSAASMHADPPAWLSRSRGAERPLALFPPLETVAKPPPLVDRAHTGRISASGVTRASVHRRRAIIVTAVRPTARA
jgi:hypothetical protein